MVNWRQPVGESQMLPERPRPESWYEACETRGVGREWSSLGFLASRKSSRKARSDHGRKCEHQRDEWDTYLSSIVCVLVTASLYSTRSPTLASPSFASCPP